MRLDLNNISAVVRGHDVKDRLSSALNAWYLDECPADLQEVMDGLQLALVSKESRFFDFFGSWRTRIHCVDKNPAIDKQEMWLHDRGYWGIVTLKKGFSPTPQLLSWFGNRVMRAARPGGSSSPNLVGGIDRVRYMDLAQSSLRAWVALERRSEAVVPNGVCTGCGRESWKRLTMAGELYAVAIGLDDVVCQVGWLAYA